MCAWHEPKHFILQAAMNIVQHSLISVRKFGGSVNDYVAVHRFLDSTKLYFHHVKHRAVLHNTYGVDLAVELFGDALETSSGRLVSVRDVAIAHLKEDLSGKVPTLVEWFGDCDELEAYNPNWSGSLNPQLIEFVNRPWLRSGLSFTKFITLSDFGVELCQKLLGVEAAIELRSTLTSDNTLKYPLNLFRFRKPWQYTPDPVELEWLKQNEVVGDQIVVGEHQDDI